MPEYEERTKGKEADAVSTAGLGSGDGPEAAVSELFTDGSRSSELLKWADENGFERPAMLLAALLARGNPYAPHLESEGQQRFIDAVLAAVRRGAVRPKIARRWLLWLWEQAPNPIISRFADGHQRRAAESVMDMHRRAIAGEAIGVAAWREARRRFRGEVSSGAFAPAVEAVVSSMWDLESAPGAIADVASTWVSESTLEDAIEQVGWPDYARVQAEWDRFAIEFSRIAKEPGEDDAEYDSRKGKYMQDHPPKISKEEYEKRKIVDDVRLAMAVQRVEELRHGFLMAISN